MLDRPVIRMMGERPNSQDNRITITPISGEDDKIFSIHSTLVVDAESLPLLARAYGEATNSFSDLLRVHNVGSMVFIGTPTISMRNQSKDGSALIEITANADCERSEIAGPELVVAAFRTEVQRSMQLLKTDDRRKG